MEIQRTLHSIGSPELSGCVPLAYYNVADAVDASGQVVVASTAHASYKNAFAIAQELESIANRSDIILAGLNTLNLQTFFEPNISTAIGATTYTLDYFAFFDMITILEPNGLLSVRF
jgi:hypothetical protein